MRIDEGVKEPAAAGVTRGHARFGLDAERSKLDRVAAQPVTIAN
jgi:hypothetical protein